MNAIWKYGAAGVLAAALATPACAQNAMSRDGVKITPNPTSGNTGESATGVTVRNTDTNAGTPLGNASVSPDGVKITGNPASGNTSESATGVTVRTP